jgi:hypothetical protein
MKLGVVTVILPIVLFGVVQPISAQVGDLEGRLHFGIVQPIAGSADYFTLGPSMNLDVLHPLSERLGVSLDLGWDYLNAPAIYPTPTTNLWRYRVGLEAAFWGQQDSGILLKALGAVGATTVRSHEFWIASRRPYRYKGENTNETAVTASGGVRLGFQTPDGITWWLTGKLNWFPINDLNQDALKELARNELDPLRSSLTAAITLGISLW